MPSAPLVHRPDPCILEDVQPLLAELHTDIAVEVIGAGHPGRAEAEAFVHRVFARRYRADVRSFYPTLLSFHDTQRRRAVVGLRDGQADEFFAEQYLPDRAEYLIGERLDTQVARADLVEVGNLALESPGDTRWTIAATTVFLRVRGYRWVLFTATRMLINAFQRLGMQPLALLAAQPGLLSDDCQHWGDYYRSAPVVCAGQIESGYHNLRRHIGPNQPALHALLHVAARRAALPGVDATCHSGGE
jgi:Thermostable hemolysin.